MGCYLVLQCIAFVKARKIPNSLGRVSIDFHRRRHPTERIARDYLTCLLNRLTRRRGFGPEVSLWNTLLELRLGGRHPDRIMAEKPVSLDMLSVARQSRERHAIHSLTITRPIQSGHYC